MRALLVSHSADLYGAERSLLTLAIGPVGLYLTMVDRESTVAVGVGVAVLVNIALNALLIPAWGITGAAVATATSLICWNVILSIVAWRRDRVVTHALGALGPGRRT